MYNYILSMNLTLRAPQIAVYQKKNYQITFSMKNIQQNYDHVLEQLI